MNSRSLSKSDDWRDLYAAALFENDTTRISDRIVQAESAMVTRARYLFASSSADQKETIELDQSLRMLHLLKTCLTGDLEMRPAA